MSESTEFLNITKNILLSEPLTYEGRKALRNLNVSMSEDQFYENKVYVEPFSVYDKMFDRTKTHDPDSSSEPLYYQEIDLNILTTTKETFEGRLKSLSDALFVIKGVAGSGKTTYLHKLKKDLAKTIDFHICNFEETKQSFDFLGKHFDLGEELFPNNVYKFISILLKEISRILKQGNMTDLEHRNYIKTLITYYYEYFTVPEEKISQSNLFSSNMDTKKHKRNFDLLKKYAENDITYTKLSTVLLNYLTSNLNDASIKSKDKLCYIAGFIIRLYFCLSKITLKKQLCVIDNIEVFVKYQEENPIQVCELEEIIEGCNEASKTIRSYLMPIQECNDYQSFYGFVVVTRDTTASTALVNMMHYDDYKTENEIDISKWYCMEDIYLSKRNFFEKKGIKINNNCYATAYENILNDFSIYRWGLNEIVSKMYKHSHRRNVECVTEAIATIPPDEVTHFNDMWSLSKEAGDSAALKTMCRKYILRILIDHVQKTNYFDKLLVKKIPTDKERIIESYLHKSLEITSSEANSLARKISTVLHRLQLRHGTETYMSFQELTKILFKKPYLPEQIKDCQFKSLAEILYIMNETRNSETNWTSLICIKFNNKETYNLDNLKKIIKDQWKKYTNNQILISDTSDFGVKITDAGSFFAKIVADFEYFSCRFLTNEPPLFSVRNIKPIIVDEERSYRAVEIIKIIRKKAFSCVNETIQRDYDFYKSNTTDNMKKNFDIMHHNEYCCLYKELNNDKEHVHPYRILNHHIGYISNYIDYVERYIPIESFDKDYDKEKLLSLVRGELTKYKNKFKKVMESNPEYFA